VQREVPTDAKESQLSDSIGFKPMELHMTERTWVGNGARCLLRGECSVPARGEQEPSTRRVAIQRRAFGIGLLSLLPFLAIACAKGLDEP